MITMHNTWDARMEQQRFKSSNAATSDSSDGGIASGKDAFDDQFRQQLLLGELVERSISAPPPTGTLDLGDGNSGAAGDSLLFRLGRNGLDSNDAFFRQDKANDDLLVGSSSYFSDNSLRSNRTDGGNTTSDGLLFGRGGSNRLNMDRPATTAPRSNQTAASEILLSDPSKANALSASSSTPSLQHLVGDRFKHDFNQQHGDPSSVTAGSAIVRPQSAAPEFSSHKSVRAPPGMGGADLSTDRASLNAGSDPSGPYGSLLFDRDSIMKAGMQRPASTGVIGQQSTTASSSSVMESLGLIPTSKPPGSHRAVGGAVRQGPKTLMDLIQEDFPKTPSPQYNDADRVAVDGSPSSAQRQRTQPGQDHIMMADVPQSQQQQQPPPKLHQPHVHGQDQNTQHQHLPRSSTDQAPSSRYEYPRQAEDIRGLSQTMQNTHISSGPANSQMYALPAQMNESTMNSAAGTHPQYVSVPVSQVHNDTTRGSATAPGLTVISQQSNQQAATVYATSPSGHHISMQTIAGSGHHVPHPHVVPHQTHQQSPYEAQTIYYSTQQQRGAGGPETTPPSHVLQTTPSGHTVYVNTTPSPYTYTAVQYHPSSAPHMHHHPNVPPPRHTIHPHQPHQPGGPHPTEFISVIPIHSTPGPAPQVATVAADGTYTYWHQPGDISGATHPRVAPTVTLVNTHGPVATTSVAVASSPPGGKQGRNKNGGVSGGRNGTEKGSGKNRRGGGASGRRGGGNSEKGTDAHIKHSPGGSNASISSILLEEFRSSKNRSWTTEDIKGHIVEFCQDQNGSRFIQQRLEVADPAEKNTIMSEVLPSVRRLRNDVFGNYVVQKLLDHGTPEMKASLRDTLTGEMLTLSLQMYGCRVVQKALETLNDDDLPGLLAEFHQNVLACIHNQNGNHVMQKCIEVMSVKAKAANANGDIQKELFCSGQIQFIIDDVMGNVTGLSCHPYGCRVLQRILEHCTDSQKTVALDEISRCHRVLLDDQYGNYVIQHVLQFGRHSDRESILHIVIESGLLSLSRQKFASNVVEKLLKYGSPEQRNAVVREMLQVVDEDGSGEHGGGTSVVILMVRDAYANYVVQTTLDVVPEGTERRLLLKELNAHSAQLRNYTFAKHIMTKLSS